MSINVGASGAQKSMLSNSSVGASSAWKKIIKVFTGASGVWKEAWAAVIWTGEITSGTDASYPGYVGYGETDPLMGSIDDPSIGSLTIAYWFDVSGGAALRIRGFSSDPGPYFFTNATADTTTLTSAAASYSYGGGVATWGWTGASWGLTDGVSSAASLT